MGFDPAYGIDSKTRMSIGLVVEEVSTNFFEHNRDSNDHYVDVKIIIENSSVILRFRDDCRPFNPKERIAMLDDRAPEHNIGLRIISKKAKRMQYVSVFNLNNFVITI
ncbi:MAG: ATP-binding protein [Lachnospiraceae bacterium]|nr:ATP-binding protein [Lachnospiraceae bacterium]